MPCEGQRLPDLGHMGGWVQTCLTPSPVCASMLPLLGKKCEQELTSPLETDSQKEREK